MSKTDKTRPGWVQMTDPENRGWLEESHDHRHGECDIHEADPTTWRGKTSCTLWPSGIAYHSGIYPAATKVIAYYRWKALRHERTEWRRVARDLVKSSREEIYDNEHSATQHRRGAKWDAE